MKTRFYFPKFILLFAVAFSSLLSIGCSGIRIVATPTAEANFRPVGDSECIQCGQAALSECREQDPESFPKWFGFTASGGCYASCDNNSGRQITGISGPSLQTCPYEITTTIAPSGEVCPSGKPTSGDRDFFGHGPRVSGRIIVALDSSRRFMSGFITATWAETAPGTSSITLERTRVGISDNLSSGPFVGAPPLVIESIVTASSTDFSRTMASGEEEIISPSDGEPLVRQLVVVGDTEGGDISDDTNCNDDARVKGVVFNPVRVRMGPRL